MIGSSLYTFDKLPPSNTTILMRLFIRPPGSSQHLCLNGIEGDSTVGELKSIIRDRLSIDTPSQRLVCGGRLLTEEHASLVSMGLRNDSTVGVLLRLRGGVMSVFVKILGGKVITVPIEGVDCSSVADLQKSIQEIEGLEPEKYNLVYQAQVLLHPTALLSAYKISPDATIDVVPVAARPKGRCAAGECTDRVAKIIGDCKYCGMGYCSRHRLPESHQCDNIQGCKQQSFEKNSSKLMGEKCVADRV